MPEYDPTQPKDVKKVLKVISKVYCKFLKSVDFDDELFLRGINEGKNKFLSNAWGLFWQGSKYDKTQYISEKALEELRIKGKNADLVFEHIVPKKAYQTMIENEAKKKKQDLDEKYIESLLSKYWLTATVTADEDKALNRKAKEIGLYSNNQFLRYKEENITLLRNENLVLNQEKFAELSGKL